MLDRSWVRRQLKIILPVEGDRSTRWALVHLGLYHRVFRIEGNVRMPRYETHLGLFAADRASQVLKLLDHLASADPTVTTGNAVEPADALLKRIQSPKRLLRPSLPGAEVIPAPVFAN